MLPHSETIKKARERKGLTQRQLAEIIGFTDTYIARIERGYTRGSFNAISRIAEALNIPQERLLKEAEFELPKSKNPQLDAEDYEFAKLPPKIKKFLLNISEEAARYTES